MPRTIYIEARRERLDSQGYTKHGRYFGVGVPLYYWTFWNKETNEEDSGYMRAYSRKEVVDTIKKKFGVQKNPAIPKDKWIKAKAVKFCRDGRVQVKK